MVGRPAQVENFGVRHLVLPGDAENAPEASQVKGVEFFLLA